MKQFLLIAGLIVISINSVIAQEDSKTFRFDLMGNKEYRSHNQKVTIHEDGTVHLRTNLDVAWGVLKAEYTLTFYMKDGTELAKVKFRRLHVKRGDGRLVNEVTYNSAVENWFSYIQSANISCYAWTVPNE